MRQERGITLVSLVITIIILVILAGVAIAVLNQNDIIFKAKNAAEIAKVSQMKEAIQVVKTELMYEKIDNNEQGEVTAQEVIDRLIQKGTLTPEDVVREGVIKVGNTEIEVTTEIINTNDNNSGNINDNIHNFTPIVVDRTPDSLTIKGETTSVNSVIIAYVLIVNEKAQGMAKAGENLEITATNLTADTEYTVFIVAIDNNGNTKKSAVIKTVTKHEFIFSQEYLQSGSIYGNTVITTGNEINNSAGLSMTGTSSRKTGTAPDLSLYLRWYKNIDLTNYSKLTFYAKKGMDHGNVYVYIGGSPKLQKSYRDFPTEWIKYEIDISNFTGSQEIAFVGGYVDTSGNATSNTQYCDIRLIE